MINCIKKTSSSYKGPTRDILNGRLLEDELYEVHERKKQKILDANAEHKFGMTIAADGATISKRPLTDNITVA